MGLVRIALKLAILIQAFQKYITTLRYITCRDPCLKLAITSKSAQEILYERCPDKGRTFKTVTLFNSINTYRVEDMNQT